MTYPVFLSCGVALVVLSPFALDLWLTLLERSKERASVRQDEASFTYAYEEEEPGPWPGLLG